MTEPAPEPAQVAVEPNAPELPKRTRRRRSTDSPARAETTTNLDTSARAETTTNLDSPARAETTADLDTSAQTTKPTSSSTDSPVRAETTADLDTSAQATKPKRTRRRKKAGSTAAEASPTDSADAVAPAIEAQPSTDSADAVAPTIEDAPAKKPRRTRKRKPAETPAEAGESAKEPPSEPEPPPRPPIRHPMARVQFQNGVPTILFGERAFAPHFFFGNPYSPEAAVRVQQQIQLAAEAGVHLYSLLITLPVRETGAIEAFDQIRYWTALARETDPDAHFLWRIAFAPTSRWHTEYPEAVIRFADGSSGGPSVCADRWWQVAKAQLVTLVELVEQQDEGGATLGYHLDYGEWFLSESGGYDTSEAALGAFREWLRRQYKGDSVVLRACWFNGEVSFSTATLPPFQPAMPQGRIQHFYHPRREGRWIDYHRFLSDITARRIIGLAQAVKDASQRRALVGAPYGYVLEWKHPYAGHFALNQILQSEHIDILSAPLSYTSRLPGELGALPTPVDSVNLHGKLFISEEDYRTPFGKTAHATDPSTGHHLGSAQAEATPDDDYNPPLHTAHTVQQVHTRSLAQSLALAHGEMWMDLWGEGWLAHPDAWNAARNAVSLWNLRLRAPQTPPEVAVIIDPESTRYVRTGSPLIEQMVAQAREAVLRSGASVGFYLLEDIVRRDFPPSRVVIFLNAWRMSRAAHEAIRKRLQRDGRVLIWLYASTLFHGHRDALASARETLGVAIARQPWASMQGTQVVNKAHPLARFLGADKLGASEPWEPSFYAIAEGCDAIGEYVDTGLPSLAVCDHKTWKAVFLGERRLTPELVRALVRWAGGHIWLDGNDLVQARYPWVHVHARKSGARTLQFPMPLSVYDTAEAALVTESVMEHTLYLQEGESRLLLVAPHELMLRLLQGEPIQLPPYFELTETPDVSEPVVESAAPTLEPDWEEPVLEPIALEESPFEPVETHDVLAPEAEPASEPSGAERRNRRRTRGRRGKPARAKSAQKSTPATTTDFPIIPVQWRRSSEDS
ncbi:MAG: hypothetical protein KatS3mg020_0407 [Fimbriimonadales bacterium]|nr:MAG: hypothetical protein KatS3mg020_0407 [Fimbriimonadales bacterium]